GTAFHGPESDGHRRLQDDSSNRRDAVETRGVRGDHGHRRFRCAGQDRRSSSGDYLRRYHDAAPGWLPDLRPDQEQSCVQVHAGDHAVLQGWPVRQGQGAYRRFRSVFDQAVQQGRTAGRDQGPCAGVRGGRTSTL
ncbi:twitching motility protein PilG, partial [Pseudomonas sp. FEN]